MSYKPLVPEEDEKTAPDEFFSDITEKRRPTTSVTSVQGVATTDRATDPQRTTALQSLSLHGKEDGPFTPEPKDEDDDAVPLVEAEEHPDRNLFVKDSKKCRAARKVLACGVFVMLLGFLAAAIALIATSPSCRGEGEGLVWWKTTVIYQCYPRSFQDSDGDGSGDLNGILERVNYFVDIGIKTVWLNPIFTSPNRDNGYDVSNYTDIEPLFGTLDDFKALLRKLHENGIHLLLDFVPNHTSDEHPWFLESRSSRDSSKRDWYIWANASEDGGPPNNWISLFGGGAWTYDNQTDQYYLHQFSEFQPDLNYRNPEVISAMEDVLEFWLDLGVDGFRVDAVIFLLEDPKLQDEPENPDFVGNCTTNISDPNCYNSLLHNLTTNYPGIHEIIRNWRKLLDSFSNSTSQPRFMVGEAYDPIETVMLYYGKNGDEFHFPFNFFLLENSNWTGSVVSEIVSNWLDHSPKGAWPNWVLGNHDNSRIASKAGIYLARALNVLLLTLPGTPTTYYGEEILMTDVYVPPPERHDPYQDRDKERTPMQWNASANAGFTTNAKPWLPVPDNYTTYNVAFESSAATGNTSMLTLYKKLVELRSSHTALQFADYEHVKNDSDIFAYHRYHENSSEDFLVIVNFSELPTTCSFVDDIRLNDPEIVLSSNLNRTGGIRLDSVDLLGGEALVVKGKKSCG